jgi:hypothetical protein
VCVCVCAVHCGSTGAMAAALGKASYLPPPGVVSVCL